MMKRHTDKHILVNRSISFFYCLWLLSACCLLACEGGEDPLVLGGQVPETGEPNAGTAAEAGEEAVGEIMAGEIMAGESMVGEIMAGEPNTGGSEVEVICEEVVDEQRFASEIGPEMIQSCASIGCHANGPTGFNLPVDNTYTTNPLEDQVLADSLAAVMSDPLYIIPGEPQQSLMLTKASNGHGRAFGTYPEGEAKYEALSSWIESMRQCTEVEVPQAGQEMAGQEITEGMAEEEPLGGINGGGNTELLCDLLPNGDPQQRSDGQYYSVFETEINTILTSSCGRSGCHASSENGFWLQPQSDPCSVPGNFLMTQAYIDFVNFNNSPILEAPYDPYHSGYTIFTGRTDERFIAIQSWILLAFQDED